MNVETTTDVVDDVRDSIAAWREALHDRDARRLMAAYAADTVNFDIAPPLRLSGAEALDPSVAEGWFATWTGPIGWEHRDLEIHVSGDLAVAHALVHLTGPRTDGEQSDGWLRQTLALRKDTSGWRIIHEHTSVPLYMDGSGRAAVDLEP